MNHLMRNRAIGCKLIILYILLCAGACSRTDRFDTIIFPADSAMNDADRYAVITETYISLKDTPGPNGITVNHARRKDIYAVTGTQFVSQSDKSELWIHLSEGWLPYSAVDLYSSKEKAETAAAQLQ